MVRMHNDQPVESSRAPSITVVEPQTAATHPADDTYRRAGLHQTLMTECFICGAVAVVRSRSLNVGGRALVQAGWRLDRIASWWCPDHAERIPGYLRYREQPQQFDDLDAPIQHAP